MSKLAILVLGAAIALGAQTRRETSGKPDQSPPGSAARESTTPDPNVRTATTGTQTAGSGISGQTSGTPPKNRAPVPSAGAVVNGQAGTRDVSPNGPATTGTPASGAGISGESVPPENSVSTRPGSAAAGAQTGSPAKQGQTAPSDSTVDGQPTGAANPAQTVPSENTVREDRTGSPTVPPASGAASTPPGRSSRDSTRNRSGAADRSDTSASAPAANSAAATGSAGRAMPGTAAGWLGMLFGGSLLSGAGLRLLRLRR